MSQAINALTSLQQALDKLKETAALIEKNQVLLPGYALYQMRREAGLTQGQLAKAISQTGQCSVSIQDVFNWEQNRTFMTREMAELCCEVITVCGVPCTPEDFLLDENKEYVY